MKRLLLSLSFITLRSLLPCAAQTLEECQQAAERNYPLIRQYGLIEQTAQLTVANIQKGWLPQLSALAQATLQSDVTAFPEQLQDMYRQLGIDMQGLKRDQYRVGIDVQQTLYDGGAMRSQKEVARRQAGVEAAQNEVSIYQVRKRVNEMYFAALLLDEQIRLNRDHQQLLSGNERKLESMVRGGTAAESDYLSVKAERLGLAQQLTALESQKRMLTAMLYAFCGITSPSAPEEATLVKPSIVPSTGDTPELRSPATEGTQEGVAQRPELKAIDAQLRLADAQEQALDAALMPRLSLFAQGYYGYPGLNMFHDMMNRRWSLNGIIGARLTWNIGALYTRRNDKARLQLVRDRAENSREVFLFNNRIEQMQHSESIGRYRRMMADDEQIIALRRQVRKAAESKLAHGIIDVNDLLRDINQENAACLQQQVHQIQMLKEIYDSQYTIGIK